MGLQRVKIINQTDGIFGTHCIVGDSEIHGVKSVNFNQSVDEVPVFTFETIGLPEIEMQGLVQFVFTPETVQQAAIVLQNEFKNNPEARKALIKSIESALKEMPSDDEVWSSDVAEKIANRIVDLEK